jgi:hypothetical protein
MLLIGSALLLAIGLLVLLWQAIVISYHLLRLAVLLVIWCGYAVVLVVCAVCLAIQYILGRFKPEPVVMDIYLDDEDVPTIELPHTDFRRL